MSPEQFAVLWEAKHEKLTPTHRELMLERLVAFNVRGIEDRWIKKALEEDGLKKLMDIIYTALEYQDAAKAESDKHPFQAKQSEVVIQGTPRRQSMGTPKRTIGELWSLCNDTSPIKRARAAESSQAIPAMLSQLARDSKEIVREAVGSNSQAPLEVLALLADDSQPRVRFRVASNPRTPIEVLKNLVRDDNPEVSAAAIAQQGMPRKYIASDAFYSIGMTMDEGIHPDVILLDANVVLLLEEWARSSRESKDFGDLNESVRPLLKVLRETKFATFEQGALESAWPSPKRDTYQAENLIAFNKARMTDLVNLLTYLRKGSDQDAEGWLASDRSEGLRWGSSFPNDFDFQRAKTRIVESWMLACLLIDHVTVMEENEGTSNLNEIHIGSRIRRYKDYLAAVSELGLVLEGEMLFIARMGFFGGRVRFGSRSFDFADITKKPEWSRRGTLAIGRNIAMDVALIRVARDLRLSSGPQKALKTSIITGDLGLLAIFQYIVKEWREEATGLTLVKYEWPPDSEIFQDTRPFHASQIAEDPISYRSKDFEDVDWLVKELLVFAD
jgi:hypothetical protein